MSGLATRGNMVKAAASIVLAIAVAILIARTSGGAASRTVQAAGDVSIVMPQSQARYTIRRLEGDVNADCQVNVVDDQEEGRRYLSALGNLLYARAFDVNLPQPDNIIDVSDLQFVFGRNGSTCSAPIPPQPPTALNTSPAAADVTLTKDPTTANIWICQSGTGLCGTAVPTQLGHHSWQNGIVFDEVMTVNVPVAAITAYSFELKYDPAIFQPPVIEDQGVLEANGATQSCSRIEPSLGDVTFHCVSSGPSTTWAGPKTVAKVTMLLQPGPSATIRPSKENGMVTDIFDVGAIVTGVLSTPTPNASATSSSTPTASATATTLASTQTPVPTATNTPTATATSVASATSTPVATATNTAVPTDTATPTATNTAVPTDTATPTATNTAVPTDTPTATATNTAVPTSTATPTASNTAVPTVTNTPTPTSSNTPVPTSTRPGSTATPAATRTRTPQPTGTAAASTTTPRPTATRTAVPTATNTRTPQPTGTAASGTTTPRPTATRTAVPTATNTRTPQPTGTAASGTTTPRPTATRTAVPTATNTRTPQPTGTAASGTTTPRPTATRTAVPTATSTRTPQPTGTAVRTTTPGSGTRTAVATTTSAPITQTPQPTRTASPAASSTPRETATAARSATAAASRTAAATTTSVATPTPPPTTGCALSQGYWKNHTGAWPLQTLTLGSQTYDQAALVALLAAPSRGDASVILAKQLIAAKLNAANGAGGAENSISNADTLLAAFTGALPYHITTTSSAGSAMVTVAADLATFNESCDQSVHKDTDRDGYDDDRETELGLDPYTYCGIARADVMAIGRITISQLSYLVVHRFDPAYVRRLDQNGDGSVNILDIIITARYWGMSIGSCP